MVELGKQGCWVLSGLAQKPQPILLRKELRLNNIEGVPVASSGGPFSPWSALASGTFIFLSYQCLKPSPPTRWGLWLPSSSLLP